MAKRKYRSEALRVAHATVEGLHKIGLADKTTMREFDDDVPDDHRGRWDPRIS